LSNIGDNQLVHPGTGDGFHYEIEHQLELNQNMFTQYFLDAKGGRPLTAAYLRNPGELEKTA